MQRTLHIITCLFILMWAFPRGAAQTFPVTVTPRVTPPAPVYLSSYADATASDGPLQVQILLNDLNVPGREIRLKAYFEGNGVTAQSVSPVAGAPALAIEGGIPLTLTNAELAPYLEFSNLTGISPGVYGSPLPEGAYKFCFEVYDVVSGNRISQKSCTSVYIFQNAPPFLAMPQNGSDVAVQNPENIVFQWTPRHINVSHVEYELSIVEVWDYGVDPQAAFLSSPPVFQTTTSNTTYVYGPMDPLLLPNKRYAWRVRAKAIKGTEEIGMFENRGYSEIFWFNYTAPCEAPPGVTHEVKGMHQVNIYWENPSFDVTEYTVRYREKGSDNEWFHVRSTADWTTLWDLKKGTTYEYQMSRKCALEESEYSSLQTFTTFIADDESGLYNCGIAPEIDITNREPLDSLGVDDVFKAGDFPVKVLEVSGGDGRYTGKGYVTVPYLSNVRVAVNFTNVFINADKQLTEGMVITKYDPDLGNIVDVDDAIDTGEDVVESVGEMFEGDNDLDEIRLNFPIPPGEVEDYIKVVDDKVVITNPENGASESSLLGDDKVVIDSEGNTYHVDAGGNITEGGPIDEGGAVVGNNVEGVNNNGQLTSLTSEDVLVTFEAQGSTYGFDEMPASEKSALKDEYRVIKDADGNDYVLVHKAVEKDKSDNILARVQFKSDKNDLSDIVFKTRQGEIITAENVGDNLLRLNLKGYYTYENQTIYAVVKAKDSTRKQQTAGAFTLWHLTDREVNVKLVKVNGASVSDDVGKKIRNIFKKGVTTVNIEIIDTPFSIDGNQFGSNGLDVGDSPWLGSYNDEQKAFIRQFKNEGDYQRNTYYLFVFGNDIRPSRDIAGFMPLQRQFGFVFNPNAKEEGKDDLATTIAHEIGHGVFALQHPFTQFGTGEGNTPWLMDYSRGQNLPHMDWAQMHNPALKFYVFQDEEEGELAGKWWFTPDWKLFKTNSTNVINSARIDEVPQGTVPGITYDSLPYDAKFDDTGNFLGYFNGNKKFEKLQQRDKMEHEKDSVFLLKNNGQCGLHEWYGTTYGYAIKNKTDVDYTNTEEVKFKGDISCGMCSYGKQFYETYKTSVRTENEKASLLKVAELICERGEDYYDALVSQIEKLNRDKKDSYFWDSEKYMFREAQEAYWDRPDAWENYLLALEDIITLYEENTDLQNVNTADLFFLLEYCSVGMLQQLSAKEKVEILQFILTNEAFITEGNLLRLFKQARDEEGLIVKLIAGVKPEQSGEFLDELQNYEVENKNVFAKLMAVVDDRGGGKKHFTALNQMLFIKLIEAEGGIERYMAKYKDMETSFTWYYEQHLWILAQARLVYHSKIRNSGKIDMDADFRVALALNPGDDKYEINCLTGDCSDVSEIIRKRDEKNIVFKNFVPPTTLDPYEVVMVEFSSDIEGLDIKKGTYLPLPAFFFYATLNQGNWEILKQDVSDITTIGTSAFAGGALLKEAQGIERIVAVGTLFFNTVNTAILTDERVEWLKSEPSGKGEEFLKIYRLTNVLNDVVGLGLSGNGLETFINTMSMYLDTDEAFGKSFRDEFPEGYNRLIEELNKLR